MFEPLPALIRMQREAQRLTIDGLSALAGVSRTRLIALERGEDNISLELLVKIANALRIRELRIGGLMVEGTTPDVNTAIAAADAIQTARRVVLEATMAAAELDRVAAPIAAILGNIITPAEALDSRPFEAKPRPKRGRPKKRVAAEG